MPWYKKITLQYFVLLLLCYNTINSQNLIKDSVVAFPYVQVHYNLQYPFGNIGSRFGLNSNIGATFSYKTSQNIFYTAEFSFLFGNKVKENDILLGIGTADSNIIGVDGQYKQVRLFERGFTFFVKSGKILYSWGPNPNSGLLAQFGVGILQHKIRIEDLGDYLPQLSADYLKGYDRLTNGLALNQSVGYVFFNNNQKINIYTGFNFVEALTKNRRKYNYDTQSYDTDLKFDLLIGYKIAFIIPIYKSVPDKFYYY